MSNFTQPIQEAFGLYLGRAYAAMVADTPGMEEFINRGFSKSAVWAPGRMIDQVEGMLESWRKNDNDNSDQPRPYLPVIVAAMSKDFMPGPPDFARPQAEPVDVVIPNDPKNRVFKMRAVVADVRVQLAVFAQEAATARSIVMQLYAFATATSNRRFRARYRLAGLDDYWPVVLESTDLMGVSAPTEVKNLTVLTVDIQLRATVPMLSYPKRPEPNDGVGDGTPSDPDGYLVVERVDGTHAPGPGYESPITWTVQ